MTVLMLCLLGGHLATANPTEAATVARAVSHWCTGAVIIITPADQQWLAEYNMAYTGGEPLAWHGYDGLLLSDPRWQAASLFQVVRWDVRIYRGAYAPGLLVLPHWPYQAVAPWLMLLGAVGFYSFFRLGRRRAAVRRDT